MSKIILGIAVSRNLTRHRYLFILQALSLVVPAAPGTSSIYVPDVGWIIFGGDGNTLARLFLTCFVNYYQLLAGLPGFVRDFYCQLCLFVSKSL
jgi:hypothetical protein